MTDVKLTRVRAGWYATADGTAAVMADGYDRVSATDRDGDGITAGITGREWAAVVDPGGRLRTDGGSGDNLDWFDTKREAVAYLSRYLATRRS